MRNVHKILILIFSAFILFFAFPPYNIWILSFFSLIPLFLIIYTTKSKSTSFLYGFIFGLVFFLSILFWMVSIEIYTLPRWFLILGWFLTGCILSIYIGFFSLGYFLSARYLKRYLFLPLFSGFLWSSLEVIRERFPLGGFPWASLGYSQVNNLLFIQIAEFIGVYGISACIVLINSAISCFILFKDKKILLYLLFPISFYIFGILAMNKDYTNREYKVDVVIIQPSISMYEKYTKENIFFKLQKLIFTNKEKRILTDLVIFPETTLLEPIKYKQAKKIINMVNKKFICEGVLMGAIYTKEGKNYNSAYLISKACTLSRYDKLHLVPFGEYLPWEEVFPFLRKILKEAGDYIPGDKKTIFTIKNLNFRVLICYEGIFTNINGGNFLVNITNDSWSISKLAYFQHLYMLPLRAIENRMYIIRAANSGISCVIDPKGRIQKSLGINQQGIITATIFKNKDKTFYSKYLTLINTGFIILSLLLLIFLSDIKALVSP